MSFEVPISFFTPIESEKISSCWQHLARRSDWLLGVGKYVYELKDANVLVSKTALPTTRKEKILKLLLIATVVPVIAAFIFKCIDRFYGEYRFIIHTHLVNEERPKGFGKLDPDGCDNIGLSQAVLESSYAQSLLSIQDKLPQYQADLKLIKAQIAANERKRYQESGEWKNFVKRGTRDFGAEVYVKTVTGQTCVFSIWSGALVKHLDACYRDAEGIGEATNLSLSHNGKQALPEELLEAEENFLASMALT